MIVSRKQAEEAAAVFGFDIASGLLDAQAVNAAYRTEAAKAHPDAGGSVSAFAAVDRAKHVLLAWLARRTEAPTPMSRATCPRCEGSGYFMARRGFGTLRTQCPTCRGAGELSELDNGDGNG